MAEKTQGTDILEIALSAAFRHRENMIGIPKAPTAGDGLHTVKTKSRLPSRSSRALERGICGNRVDSARSTTAMVASEDLIAKVSGIGSEAPLVDAIIAAKGPTTLRNNLKLTPAAERKTAGTEGQIATADVTSGKCAGRNLHGVRKIESEFEVDLNRFDQGHQPGQEFLVDRVVMICIECGAIGKLHYSAKLITPRTRGKVMPDMDLQQAGDLSLKRLNLFEGTLFLTGVDLRFPMEEKGMHDHELSLI
jgi:hypothetical protein